MFFARIFKTVIIAVVSLLFIITLSCDRDETSTVSEIDIETDLLSKGIELEEIPYNDSELPEIWSTDALYPGRYKMGVGEALSYKGQYIYFQRRIDSNRNRVIDNNDTKVRILLNPPIENSVNKYTSFGTLLHEYGFKVVVDIIGYIGTRNPDGISEYEGSLVSLFKK